MVEETLAKTGRFMTGRQNLFKLDQHFKVSKVDGSLLELRDILGIHMINGDLR